MLVHLTSITTITNKRAVNPLQICHIFEKKVTKHSLYRPLHLVNFWSPKCRKCQFRGLRNTNFDGGESPRTTLKGCRHSYFDTHPPLPDEKSFLRHCTRTLNFPFKSPAGVREFSQTLLLCNSSCTEYTYVTILFKTFIYLSSVYL